MRWRAMALPTPPQHSCRTPHCYITTPPSSLTLHSTSFPTLQLSLGPYLRCPVRYRLGEVSDRMTHTYRHTHTHLFLHTLFTTSSTDLRVPSPLTCTSTGGPPPALVALHLAVVRRRPGKSLLHIRRSLCMYTMPFRAGSHLHAWAQRPFMHV